HLPAVNRVAGGKPPAAGRGRGPRQTEGGWTPRAVSGPGAAGGTGVAPASGAGARRRRSSGTSQIASAAMRHDILLVPRRRLRNTIGISTTRKPAPKAR